MVGGGARARPHCEHAYRRFAENIPNARLHMFPDGKHNIHIKCDGATASEPSGDDPEHGRRCGRGDIAPNGTPRSGGGGLGGAGGGRAPCQCCQCCSRANERERESESERASEKG